MSVRKGNTDLEAPWPKLKELVNHGIGNAVKNIVRDQWQGVCSTSRLLSQYLDALRQ